MVSTFQLRLFEPGAHSLLISNGHSAKLPFVCGPYNIDFKKSNGLGICYYYDDRN